MSFDFGFGSRTTWSWHLMEGAYAAGRRGRHGVRGDEHFEDWLDGQAERYPDLHSGFIGRLRAEYFRGVEAHEQALKAPEAPADGQPLEPESIPEPIPRGKGRPAATERRESKEIAFKGHRIEPTADGEYIVPSLDRESRFEDLRQAKRFISAVS